MKITVRQLKQLIKEQVEEGKKNSRKKNKTLVKVVIEYYMDENYEIWVRTESNAGSGSGIDPAEAVKELSDEWLRQAQDLSNY